MENLINLFLNVSEEEKRHPYSWRMVLYGKRYFIKDCIKDIKETYSPDFLKRGQCDVEYTSYDHRWAYTTYYGMFHSQMVYECLNNCDDKLNKWISSWAANRNLKICSLGGGPGVDCLGLLQFLFQSCGIPDTDGLEITVTTIDCDIGWKQTNAAVISRGLSEYLQWNGLRSMNFIRADLNEPLNFTVLEEIKSADVILMVKVVSALFHDRKGCEKMLQELFKNMKAGALCVYIDSKFKALSDCVEDLSDRANMVKIKKIERFLCGPFFDTELRKICKNLFGISPKKKLKSSVLILEKKEPLPQCPIICAPLEFAKEMRNTNENLEPIMKTTIFKPQIMSSSSDLRYFDDSSDKEDEYENPVFGDDELVSSKIVNLSFVDGSTSYESKSFVDGSKSYDGKSFGDGSKSCESKSLEDGSKSCEGKSFEDGSKSCEGKSSEDGSKSCEGKSFEDHTASSEWFNKKNKDNTFFNETKVLMMATGFTIGLTALFLFYRLRSK